MTLVKLDLTQVKEQTDVKFDKIFNDSRQKDKVVILLIKKTKTKA